MDEDKKYYTRTSKYKYKSKEDYIFTQQLLKDYRKETLYNKKESIYNRLLDSSLITHSKEKKYDVKVVSCGKYFQVYQFLYSKLISDKQMEKDKEILIEKSSKPGDEFGYKKIELKNINRSKMNLQRLVKANEDIFKTFITLTFEENFTDIKEANKILGKFLNNMRQRYFQELSYICIPEFQKRGAIHYHLLTNIDYEDINLLIQEEVKIWDRRKMKWQIFKTCKYWKYGFSSVIHLQNINIVGYLSKYMTKDIDNRLFGFRRFTYSQNLIHPTVTYLDTTDIVDLIRYQNMISKSDKIYSSNYLTNQYNEYEVSELGVLYNVTYQEYKLKCQ